MKPIILILGPTAGGKTGLAIALARRLPGGGECLSADSMQVYRGMDIGTAKPSVEERAAVPHHLLDIAEPSDDSFSVDRWLEKAQEAIEQIQTRGRYPIVVGGTNLYVQALLHGLIDGPEPDPELRRRLNALELTELREQLERVDPDAAQRIHSNDRKRTVRAIEVFEQTGKPLSEMQTQWESRDERLGIRDQGFFQIIGLEYPVEVINKRINARVREMMDAGFEEEVRRLNEAGTMGRNAREALGYKQMLEYLDGECTLVEAIEQIKIKTRRFAKQQRNWLRRFRSYPHSRWIEAADLSGLELATQALAAIIERAIRSPAN